MFVFLLPETSNMSLDTAARHASISTMDSNSNWNKLSRNISHVLYAASADVEEEETEDLLSEGLVSR